MARKRSRSPFPVTPAAFADRFTLPSFLSPLRRSIRSFPLLGGVSRRCNLRLNCQSTGYYFPVSLPGRSGRLGAEPARWPLGKDGTRPVEKTSTGRGRLSILAFFFFFFVKSEGWVSCVLLTALYYRIIIDDCFFCFLES